MEEFENKTSFLDITISKDDNSVQFSIYRKTTATVLIIPNDSYYFAEHKLAAVRYLTTRLSTYPMNNTKKESQVATQYAQAYDKPSSHHKLMVTALVHKNDGVRFE
jgi:hypothetical protein